MEITINQNENQTIRLNNTNLQNIGISENDNQLIGINNSETQNIGINENENQIIYIDGGGVAIGISDVLVNGVSVVSGNIAYVIVPTKTSELVNNSGFITHETDPTVPSYIKTISLADINNWNNKQDLLVSGTTIKTINNTSLLGSGNINITGGSNYSAGTGIDITNDVISNTITSYNALSDTPTIPTLTSQLTNDSDYVTSEDLSEVAFTGSYASLSNTPENLSEFINDAGYIDNTVDDLTNYMLTSDINNSLGNKQDTLVSGTNIKTINNNSLLGSGDITITQPTKTSDLTNDSNFAVTNADNNFSTKQTVEEKINIVKNNDEAKLDLNGNTALKNGTDGSTFISANNANIVLRPNGHNNNNGQFVLGTNGIATMNNVQVATLNDIPTNTSDLTNDGNGTYPFMLCKTSFIDGIGLYGGSSAYARNLAYTWVNGSITENKLVANYDDIPDINFIKVYFCTDTVTVPGNSIDAYNLRALPTISGYTFLGIIPNGSGYGDQWIVSLSYYGGNIYAMINSKYNASLTGTLGYGLIYLRSDYFNANVTQI